MKELQRFRQFLAEGKINEERKGQDKLDALKTALTDQHAKDVISSGRFTTIDTFGNGEDVTPLKNVTKELEEELEYLKNNDRVDTDEYDDASDDLEAAKEIAQVVKKMGGKVAYGGDGLMYVYSVNSKGDLLGQAVAEGQLNEYGPNVKFRPITQNDWPLEEFGFETTLYDLDSPEGEDVQVMFDTLHDFNSDEEAKQWFDRLFDPSSSEMWEEFIETEARELGMDMSDLEFDNIRPVTFANSVNENEEYKNMTFSARTLFDLIARDLKFSPLYQDDIQLSYNDAVQIMDYITQAEESDMGGETALGEYIATGEFK